MANKIASAALQYSKWLSRFICWIWAIYRFTFLIVSAIQPSASSAMADTIQGIDWIMLVNEGTYLINSLGEKYLYSDKFIMSWIRKDGLKNFFSKAKTEEDSEGEEPNG